ncbi:hypothetical protein [Streptomyces sp. NPDC055749]
MSISHTLEDGVLHVTLPSDLNVTNRAAAALETEALIYTHRPRIVKVKLGGPGPSSASLSALARARRMCASIGIPLVVADPTAPQPDVSAAPTAA